MKYLVLVPVFSGLGWALWRLWVEMKRATIYEEKPKKKGPERI